MKSYFKNFDNSLKFAIIGLVSYFYSIIFVKKKLLNIINLN